MEEIVAVDRRINGDIISFLTSTGRVISYRKAIEEIEQGVLTGVEVKMCEDEGGPQIVQVSGSKDDPFDDFPPIY